MTYHLVTPPVTQHRALWEWRWHNLDAITARLVARGVLLPGRSSGDTSPVPVEVPGTADTTVEVAS